MTVTGRAASRKKHRCRAGLHSFSRDAAESSCIELQGQKKHGDGVSLSCRQLHVCWHGGGVSILGLDRKVERWPKDSNKTTAEMR